MIHIAALDDNAAFLAEIERQCHLFEKNSDIDLNTFTNPTEFLAAFHCQYDILFMDIEMPGVDGFSVAKEIRSIDDNVLIIFITNFGSLAIKGFEVEAYDFIVKPLQKEAFQKALMRAYQTVIKRSGNYLFLGTKDDLRKVHTNSIYYIESDKHYLVFHMEGETFTERGRISDLEAKLGPYGFARCNNGCLVNLRYVDKFKNNAISVHGVSIPVSRGKRKNFMDSLTRAIKTL